MAVAVAPPAVVEAPAVAKRQRIRNVLLNLENCILSADKLSCTPSMGDGLDAEVETDLRFIGCELIQSAGILLKLPQVAMATGQVLYQRFYYSKSFVQHNFEIVAMSCIVLASKIEEAPRRVRDVLNVFHLMEQLRRKQNPEPLILDQHYMTLKNQVIKAERRILKELGFCVHVKHPHKMIVTLLEVVLRTESNDQLVQIAWNYMNDSLRSDLFVRYSPETIACACIHLAARIMQIPLPNSPSWYQAFRVSDSDINDAAFRILSLYARPKVDVERVDKIVKDLRAKQQDEKKKFFEPVKDAPQDVEAVENSSTNLNKPITPTLNLPDNTAPVLTSQTNGISATVTTITATVLKKSHDEPQPPNSQSNGRGREESRRPRDDYDSDEFRNSKRRRTKHRERSRSRRRRSKNRRRSRSRRRDRR